jgi:hypothetical protein
VIARVAAMTVATSDVRIVSIVGSPSRDEYRPINTRTLRISTPMQCADNHKTSLLQIGAGPRARPRRGAGAAHTEGGERPRVLHLPRIGGRKIAGSPEAAPLIRKSGMEPPPH